MPFTVPAEWVCLACGLPESQWPPEHDAMVTEDAFGWPQMVCTSAVQRNKYEVTILSYDTQTGQTSAATEVWE